MDGEPQPARKRAAWTFMMIQDWTIYYWAYYLCHIRVLWVVEM